ncbi:hypothetical protein FNI11_04515 [Salmonella enterica subsp. salamae]|nr:hypothetical protein [Salmonella enterica subsp. salamae]ECJ2280184.1 hypothetical protein [Salmonella enterica subsp. salamae]
MFDRLNPVFRRHDYTSVFDVMINVEYLTDDVYFQNNLFESQILSVFRQNRGARCWLWIS